MASVTSASVYRHLPAGAPPPSRAAAPRPAAFLDRDGVINEEVDYLRRTEDLRLLPGAAEAIRRLRDSGRLVIAVTNQAGVARNLFTLDRLAEIHRLLWTRLDEHGGARLDAIYFCPHHPGDGVAGGNPEFLVDCPCRKPKPGMILQAAADFGIDLAASVIVGDSWRDIACGRAAGMRTIGVRTGYGCRDRADVQPDAMADDLSAAVAALLRGGARAM